MGDDSAGRSATLLRLVGAAVATVAAVSIGAWVFPSTAGGETRVASSPPSETKLEVQPRPGECAQGSQGLISVPLAGDAPRSPAEAFVRAQKMDPELGRLTPHPADPTWGERIESGRRVSAAQAIEFRRVGGGTGWFVIETAYSAPCDYEPQRHIDSANTVYPGITPGEPRTGDWRPSGPPPPDE